MRTPAPSPVLYSDHRGRPAVGQGDSGQPGAAFQMAGRGSRPYEKGVPRSQTGRERAGDKAQAHSHMAVQAVCRPHPPAAGLKKAFSEIGGLNAGKKRDEALEMVGLYFARLERHLGQMKKYQATIDYLMQENMGQKQKVNDEKSIRKQVEILELKKENERLRHLWKAFLRRPDGRFKSDRGSGLPKLPNDSHFLKKGGTLGRKKKAHEQHRHSPAPDRGDSTLHPPGYSCFL